jgi:hypothetical protein
MTLIRFKDLDKIDYVSGYVVLVQFIAGDDAPYYVVRVSQYCDNLEYIKILSHAEAKKTFLSKCEEYKEKLSQGRPYIDLQLAEREDGLWEFRSDMHLPASFYDLEAPEAISPPPARTFKTRDEAINFGRTCFGKWRKSIEGHYDIVDREGQVTRALSLKHIDWTKVPAGIRLMFSLTAFRSRSDL